MLSNLVIKEMPVAAKMTSEIYSSECTAIFKPRMRLSGEYVFSSYSFILPKGTMPPFYVDNEKISMKPEKVIPINPGQRLKSIFEQDVDSFFAIHIDAEFMQQIAQNKDHTRILFKNENIIQGKTIESLIRKFIYEFSHKQMGYQKMLQSISTELTVEILRNSIVSRSLQSMPRHNPDIQKAIAFLEERYQEHLTLYDLAKEVSLSPYHLLRIFKSETGKTPLEFLTEIRIRHAKKLLETSNLNITETGNLCGFSNASHFSSVFKKKTGLTPSEFKTFQKE